MSRKRKAKKREGEKEKKKITFLRITDSIMLQETSEIIKPNL